MDAWPWDPQSLLGPDTRAHATYHQPACKRTGSSNIIAYFSLKEENMGGGEREREGKNVIG